MSLLDDAFWDAFDAAQGSEDEAFAILKRKLADPSPALVQELRWLHGKYGDDIDDVLRETLSRIAERRREGQSRE